MVRLPYFTALTTLFSYGLLFAFGQMRDFFRKILDFTKSQNLQGYAPICLGLEDFYTRRLYLRIQEYEGNNGKEEVPFSYNVLNPIGI